MYIICWMSRKYGIKISDNYNFNFLSRMMYCMYATLFKRISYAKSKNAKKHNGL